MQLDQIGIFLKKHCQPLYRVLETAMGGAVYFRDKVTIDKALSESAIKGSVGGKEACVRALKVEDLDAFERFFSGFSDDYLEFFKPHGFSRRELLSILKKPYYLLYGLFVEDEIVGYGILKLFWGRKAFRGRLVAQSWGGKGIGHYLSQYINWQCEKLGFRARSTISKHNHASLKSHEIEGHYTVLSELPNDYMLIEFKPVMHGTEPKLEIK